MKTQLAVVITVMVCIVIMGFGSKYSKTDNKFETTAIYLGPTHDDQFEFLDEEDEYIYFDSIVPSLKVDLYDEMYIDKEFHIFWIEEERTIDIEEADEDTEPFRIITKIKEL